jgi:hypothetical protein
MTALAAGHNPASGVSPLPSTVFQKVIASGSILYRNAVVAKNTSGQWVPASADASLVCHGFARLDQGADSITGDGTKELKVDSGCKTLTGSGLTIADEGKVVYVVDDQTFSLSSSSGARPVMGLLMKVRSSTSGDVAIDPLLSTLLGGEELSAGASTELTIASGAVTATGSVHTIDTEGDAASDDLDTISGSEANRLYLIRPASAARTVVIRDNSVGSGNIYTPHSQSISLAEAEDWALLASDGTKLSVVGFRTKAANGGGMGVIVGLLSALTTTDKASAVAAINEVNALAIQAIKMQAVDATLVNGTVTINTVIVVAADSEIVAFPKGAITGSANFACVQELIASRTPGGAGVASIVIQAVGADGAIDADAAGAVRVVILTPLA